MVRREENWNQRGKQGGKGQRGTCPIELHGGTYLRCFSHCEHRLQEAHD